MEQGKRRYGRAKRSHKRRQALSLPEITYFTGTKLQILTHKAPAGFGRNVNTLSVDHSTDPDQAPLDDFRPSPKVSLQPLLVQLLVFAALRN